VHPGLDRDRARERLHAASSIAASAAASNAPTSALPSWRRPFTSIALPSGRCAMR
jgi:hypothetical protein